MTIRGTDYVLRVRVACQCIQREKSLSHPKLAAHFSRLLEFLMSKRSRDAYAAPTVLKPFQKKNPDLVQVVIETPKGSRNKYEFDPKLRTFTLSKVLPSGMVFPHDFGFIPSTEADDGDPVDVLILMDEPAFPGCVITSRLIGVIKGEETKDRQTERNDRLVAVAEESYSHSNVKELEQLNKTCLEEVEAFFVNSQKEHGKKFKVLGIGDSKEAFRLLRRAIEKAA